MTVRAKDDGRRLPSLSRSSLAAGALVAALLVLSTAACDTVAQIPFGERSFQDVRPVSVTSVDGQGSQQCSGFTGSADLEMILIDDEGMPIAPGEDLARLSLGDSDVSVDMAGNAVYSLPDVSCSSDDDCPGSFDCGSTDSDDVGNRCQISTGVGVPQEFETAEVVADRPETQAVGVAISEFGQWRGWYSGEFGDLYIFDPDQEMNLNYDEQNDTITNSPVDEVMVDPGFNRQNALGNFAGDWGRLSTHLIESEEREALFGAWTFGEQPAADTRSLIFDQTDDERWTAERSVAEQTFDTLDTNPGRSAVLSSMLEVLDDYDDPALQGVDHRALVFVVAGPDELRNTDVDEVINRAQQLDVEVSVVHIDPELSDSSYLRDDWVYYSDQDPCDSDDECNNFEACRHPTPYTEEDSSSDPDDLAYPDDLDTRYCLPEYDENGRVGPVDYYDQIACETGGDYAYVPGNSQTMMEGPLRPIVHKFEGAWATNFVVNDYGAAESVGSAHLLEMDLEVDIFGNTQTHRYFNDGSSDTRRAVIAPGD